MSLVPCRKHSISEPFDWSLFSTVEHLFNPHPPHSPCPKKERIQTKVVLKEGWYLVRGSFTWIYYGKVNKQTKIRIKKWNKKIKFSWVPQHAKTSTIYTTQPITLKITPVHTPEVKIHHLWPNSNFVSQDLIFRQGQVPTRSSSSQHYIITSTIKVSVRLSLNVIQIHKKFKRTLFIRTKTQSAHFWGNTPYQATKQHLNS